MASRVSASWTLFVHLSILSQLLPNPKPVLTQPGHPVLFVVRLLTKIWFRQARLLLLLP